jgi:predicted CXXCH cytochrome family protein
MGVPGYRAYLQDGGKPTIFAAKNATPETRMKQCDSCHTFDSESPVTWVPTPEGYTHEMWKRPLRPTEHTAKGQFYGDGTDMSPCTIGTVFRASKMGRHGSGIECSTCHDPHGTEHWADLRHPITENQLCLTCHAKDFPDEAAIVRHTRHAPKSPGSLCAECHMPRDKRFTNGIQVMSDRLPSHAFSVPLGEEPANGPPSACNVCHTDRDTAWVRDVLRAWRSGLPPPK